MSNATKIETVTLGTRCPPAGSLDGDGRETATTERGMTRQVLTDGSGRWFNIEKAKPFHPEGRHQDTLYRTRGGCWVRHWQPLVEGLGDTWEVLTESRAHAWLSTHGFHGAIDTSSLEI
jgi:hypothetical protein